MDRLRLYSVKHGPAVTPLGDRPCLLSRRLLPRVRHEQALAEAGLAELPDQALCLRRHYKICERAAARDVDARRVLRIQLEYVVDVIQSWVPLDHRHELQLVA